MAKGHKIKRYTKIYRSGSRQSAGKVIAIVLALGVLFAAGWFLYTPVYNFILSYGDEPQQPLLPDSSQPSSQPEPSQSSGKSPEPPPAGPDDVLKMAYVPHSVAANAATLSSYINALPRDAVNAVVIDLKNETGQVLYATGLPDPVRFKAVAADAYDLARVVNSFQAAGIRVVGRIWGFKDHIAPAGLYDAAVKYMGTEYNWMDNSVEQGGKPWLNPYHPEAQEYLLALAGEALDAGVSGIVMAGVQFPEGFSLDKANYGAAAAGTTRSAVLAAFMGKMQALVESKDGIGCWNYVSATRLLSPPQDAFAPYGENQTAFLQSAHLMVEVMPSLFGSGLELASGSIAAPLTKPYDTVKAVLTAAGITGGQRVVVPVVQAYTQPGYAAEYNLTYTKTQVEDQLRAAAELGLAQGYLLYNPAGDYSILR